MQYLYYILFAIIIASSISPLMAQCDGNACYITLDNPSHTKTSTFPPIQQSIRNTSSDYKIHYQGNFLRKSETNPIVNPFYTQHNISEYCQFEETLVIINNDTFECVEDISSWIKV